MKKSNFTKTEAIPTEIFLQLRNTLSKTPFFDNMTSLKNLFSQSGITQWKNDLPEGLTTSSRIDGVVAFLYEKINDSGENGLICFLQIIHANTHEKDHLRVEIDKLIKLLRPILPPNNSYERSVFLSSPISKNLILSAEKNTKRTSDHIERSIQLDYWATAYIKSRLNILSEMVANESIDMALYASSVYQDDILNILVPLIVDMRWNRGYKSSFERLINLPKSPKKLKKFDFVEVDPPCKIQEGVLSAKAESVKEIIVFLDKYPAVRIQDVQEEDFDNLMVSINSWGRLGHTETDGIIKPLISRISEVTIQSQNQMSEVMNALYTNRELLYYLIARLDMPQKSWLLPKKDQIPLKTPNKAKKITHHPSIYYSSNKETDSEAEEHEFNAARPYKPPIRNFSGRNLFPSFEMWKNYLKSRGDF